MPMPMYEKNIQSFINNFTPFCMLGYLYMTLINTLHFANWCCDYCLSYEYQIRISI